MPVFSTTGETLFPAFSPDGSRLAYRLVEAQAAAHTGLDDQCGIYVKQVRGAPPVRLTHGETDYIPAWSPDDRYIAFGRLEDGTIRLVPSIGGPERVIAKLDWKPGEGWSGISWTPDSKWLVVSSRQSRDEPYGIWLISVETGEVRRLLTPPPFPSSTRKCGPGDFFGTLSPDARLLAFVRASGTWLYCLYTVRLTRDLKPEGQPELLVEQSYPGILGVTWASNRDVVYAAGALRTNARLWRVRAGAKSPELLSWAPMGSSMPTFAPARHLLAYAAYSATGRLWRMDLRTGERRLISDSRQWQQLPQYSPDGRKVAFQSDRSGQDEVWTCDAEGQADGTNCQQLTFFEGSQCGTPRWSPDGRFIVLDARLEGSPQIYVIASDGGKPRRATDLGAQNQLPSWSRDGKWIYFESDRSGHWRIWKAPVAGGPAVQVTRERGGAAVEIAPRVLYWGSFSITGRGAYFLSDPTTLQLADAVTGKITTVAKATKYSFGNFNITVSPDDVYMVFSESKVNGSELMLVENFR